MATGKGSHPRLKMARTPKRKKSGNSAGVLNIFTTLLIVVLVGASIAFLYKYLSSQSIQNPFPKYPSTTKAQQGNNTGNTQILTPGADSMGSGVNLPQVKTTHSQSDPLTDTTPNPVISKPGLIEPDETNIIYEQFGDTSAINAGLLIPERGCKWLGVGGQVLDMQGRPSIGVSVEAGGNLDGAPVSLSSLTGTALQYGNAGFEFTLSDHPLASVNTLWIQLVDKSQLPLTKKIYFDTYNECGKNVVIINFKQVK